jgi:hypothetical protein
MIQPLYSVWEYNDVDRAFWAEHLEDWLPQRIVDAHTHVMEPKFQIVPMSETMRRQIWVNEVRAPIDAVSADRCLATVFPKREVNCVAFGMPALDFDVDGGNEWLPARVREARLVQSRVDPAAVEPGKTGPSAGPAECNWREAVLFAHQPEYRDAHQHLEASIFDFLPHHLLEVVNDRRAWVTLHVPRAARLGHPDNIREIREIRRRYPNVVLVIAHLGRCYTEPHALEAIPPLADDPGIYFDSSAVVNPASHRVALQHIGPRRFLYGRTTRFFTCAAGGSISTELTSIAQTIRFISTKIASRPRSRRLTR